MRHATESGELVFECGELLVLPQSISVFLNNGNKLDFLFTLRLGETIVLLEDVNEIKHMCRVLSSTGVFLVFCVTLIDIMEDT